MTENIYWTLQAAIKPGCLEPLKREISNLAKVTSAEPGALSFDFWMNAEETRLFVFERYTDSAAAIAHLSNVKPHLRGFLKTLELEPIVILGNLSDEGKTAFASFNATYTTFVQGLSGT